MIVVATRLGCSHCIKMKDALNAGGIEYGEVDIDTYNAVHPSWRTNGSVEMLAALQMADGLLPIVKIDGEWMSAKEAMGELGLAPKPKFGSWRLKVTTPSI